jgi:hypothetical protein
LTSQQQKPSTTKRMLRQALVLTAVRAIQRAAWQTGQPRASALPALFVKEPDR